MVSPTPRDHTHYSEPPPRLGHYTVAIGGKLYTWGGRTQDFSYHTKRLSRLQYVIETFDPYLEAWEQSPTTGYAPPGMYDGACTAIENSMFVCCGTDSYQYLSALHQFDSTTLHWREQLERNPSEGPMRKIGCQMVSYEGDKLALFGGFGIPSGPTQPGSSFFKSTRYTDGRGWSNEFHLFHLKEGIWSSPATTGERPPPCSDFSFTTIDSHRAILFGGLQPGHGRVNDAYILDLQKMHWKKLPKCGIWPAGRLGHAACCINYGEQHPQLLVTGGLGTDNNTLRDAWLLDVDSGTWKEVHFPDGVQPRRYGHTIAAISLGPGLTEATGFGGCSKWIGVATDEERSKPSIAETTVLQFESIMVPSHGRGPPSREWVLVGVADKRQLGSPERLREKMVKLQQRGTTPTEEEMTATDTVAWAEGGMRLAERLGQVAGNVAQATDERTQEAVRRVQEADMRIRTQEAEKEVEAMKRALQESQARERELHVETEKSLQEANTRVQELVRGMQEATRQREEAERNIFIVRARAERAEVQADKVSTLEHTLQIQNDHIRRQMQQISTQVHQLVSQGAHIRELKQQLENTEKPLQSKVVEMRKQLEMKELEVLSLQYSLKATEEQVQKQQADKREFTVQLQHLEEGIRNQKDIGQTTKIVHYSSLQHQVAAGVQETEIQQTHTVIEPLDFKQASETLRNIGAEVAEQQTMFIHLRQENATLQKQLQTKEVEVVLLKGKEDDILQLQQHLKAQEEQIQTQEQKFCEQEQQFQSEKQDLQSRVEALEKKVIKEEFLESVYSQQVDQLRDDVMDREEEIYRLKKQKTRALNAVDSTRPSFGYLRGAEVVAQRSFPLSLQAHSFEWREYGFMLHVPEESLPPEMTQTTVEVRVSLSGQFKFPEDTNLVSATYWLSCPHKFMKPLDVEFQHCAAITDPSHCSQLSFVITKCTQKELPYKFKELVGGTFSQHSSYGRISLTHFSGVAVVKKTKPKRLRGGPRKVSTAEQPKSPEIQEGIEGEHLLKHTSTGANGEEEQVVEGPKEQYCAQLYKSRGPNHWRVQFVITKDLEAYLMVVQQKYAARATEDISFRIEFQGAKISLDIPSSGVTLESGWKITPRFHPMIKKADVDGFAPGKMIPECVLVLHWTKTDQSPVNLLHRIPLLGAKEQDYFMLQIEDSETSAIDGSASELSSPSGSVSSPPPQTGLVDRPKVMAYLKKIGNNQDLLMVGESLGLDGNELKKNLNSETFLFDLVGDWLSRKYRVDEVGTPTWTGLVQALEHVGQSGLANDIKKDLWKLCS